METQVANDNKLTIAGKSFESRLMIGTSRYPNQQMMLDALKASGADIVTVAVRRVSLESGGEGLFEVLGDDYHLLPNTAGCYTAKDAVLTAELAREALGTDWIKLEVIGDDETLFPDVEQLLPARTSASIKSSARSSAGERRPRSRSWLSRLRPLMSRRRGDA